MRWFLLVLAVALSGCLGGGSDAPTDAGPDVHDADGASSAPDAGPDEARRSDAAGTGAEAGPAPTTVTYRMAVHWDAEAAVFVAGTHGTEQEWLEVPVLPGAQSLEAELRWNDTVQDLDLWLDAPSCEGGGVVGLTECTAGRLARQGTHGSWGDSDGHLGAPDSPARVGLGADDLAAYGCATTGDDCTWTAFPNNKDAGIDIDYELVVAVTYPDGVPDAAVRDDATLS